MPVQESVPASRPLSSPVEWPVLADRKTFEAKCNSALGYPRSIRLGPGGPEVFVKDAIRTLGEIEWAALRRSFPDHRFFDYFSCDGFAAGNGCLVVSRSSETIRSLASVKRIAAFLAEERVPVESEETLAALLAVRRGGVTLGSLDTAGGDWRPQHGDFEIERTEDGLRVGVDSGVYRLRFDGEKRVVGCEEERLEEWSAPQPISSAGGEREGAPPGEPIEIEAAVVWGPAFLRHMALYRVCPGGNGAEVLAIDDWTIERTLRDGGRVARGRMSPDLHRRIASRLVEISTNRAAEPPVELPGNFGRDPAVWASIRVTREGSPLFEGLASGPLWDANGVATGTVCVAVRLLVDAIRSCPYDRSELQREEKTWVGGFFLRELARLPRPGFDWGVRSAFATRMQAPWVAAGSKVRVRAVHPDGSTIYNARALLCTSEGVELPPYERASSWVGGDESALNLFVIPAGFYGLEVGATGYRAKWIHLTVGSRSPQDVVVHLEPDGSAR